MCFLLYEEKANFILFHYNVQQLATGSILRLTNNNILYLHNDVLCEFIHQLITSEHFLPSTVRY